MKKTTRYICTAVILLAGNIAAAAAQDSTAVSRTSGYDRVTVGAVSKVSGEKLALSPEMSVGNILQGQLAGLTVIDSEGGIADNSPSLYIRGLHRESGNGVLVIVDGVERSIKNLTVEEIESVEILKDASTKIMYGPRAANGVIRITTKRGKPGSDKISIKVESGAGLPTDMPRYLGSYDYARLYNEARENDGLAPLYSAADLEGYRNSTGPNDFRYPDVDFYDYFLRDRTGYTKASLEFSGGTERAQYFLAGGFTGKSGLQSVGERSSFRRMNVRGNLNVRVTDFLTAFMGIGGVFDVTRQGALDDAAFFTALSTHRPNEYSFLIPEEYVKRDSLGIPGFGASMQQARNVYADQLYGGWSKEQRINGQLTMGLNFDLGKILKGLSAKGMVSIDNTFYGTESLTTAAATYADRWIRNDAGEDEVILIMRRKTNITDKQKLSNSHNLRSNSMNISIGYDNVWAETQRLSASLGYSYYKSQSTGTNQDIKNDYALLDANYSFAGKYFVQATAALMGSGKFAPSRRHSMSYAGGFAWVMSEEPFLKGSQAVDFLKVSISGGVIGYDAQTPWFLYDNRWVDNGTTDINTGLHPNRVSFDQVANPSLRWEKSAEFNIGAEAAFFGNRLMADMNVFCETRYDIIDKVDSEHPLLYGSVFPYYNWGKVRNYGAELAIRYGDTFGDFRIWAGLNVTWNRNKVLRTDEVDDPDTYRRQEGKPSDAMFGYVSEGLFGKDVPLEGHAFQTLGSFGTGDIAYKDLNGDDIIDSRDRKMLGNTHPRTQIGLDITLGYKGFSLYVLCTSSLGVYSWGSNTYFWNFGERKYSEIVLDRYHPVNNPDGTYPRLTTTDGTNNFTDSDFWIKDASFFKIKNVELSYTFGHARDLTRVLRKLKLFVRGSDLVTFSGWDVLNPETPKAGITACPSLILVTGGLSMTF